MDADATGGSDAAANSNAGKAIARSTYALRGRARTVSTWCRPRPVGLGHQRSIAEAVHRVVVHHADRLHEGVANRRADEGEPAALEILAHRIGLRRPGGNLGM